MLAPRRPGSRARFGRLMVVYSRPPKSQPKSGHSCQGRPDQPCELHDNGRLPRNLQLDRTCVSEVEVPAGTALTGRPECEVEVASGRPLTVMALSAC